MPEERLSKNQAKERAREQAARLREERLKKARRNRIVLFSSIGIVVVALVAIVGLIITSSVHNNQLAQVAVNGPKNMATGGITLTSTTKAVSTKTSKNPVESKQGSKTVNVQIYLDYQCPYCNQFEKSTSDYIAKQLNAGKITYEIHPIAILNDYSLRAASAAGCVANSDPEHYWAFNQTLYANQPDEETGVGLTNSKLVSLAKEAGITNASILSCISNGKRYGDWFTSQTAYALKKGVKGSNVKAIEGTPTVIVDGVKVDISVTDSSVFEAAVQAAAQSKGISLAS